MSSFAARLPFDELAEWQPIRALPREEQTRALRDPDVRARLIHAAHHGPYKDAVGAEARRPEFELMRVMDRPVPPNPTVAEVAAAHGVDPVEAMIDLALENFETFFLQRFGRWDVENILKTMRHPRTVLGFSDAGAHVSQMCDASLPSHLLAHWVRDRQDFTLEEGIRMLTLDQARWWGFHDRGVVRVGAKADLNVLDPATVTPDMPTVVNDLPANQRRIKQTATGYLATIVNGRVTLEGGEPSGALPGQLLRGPLAVNR
jgi:N-acyl-D-aspartate/D-glutamate deacylase